MSAPGPRIWKHALKGTIVNPRLTEKAMGKLKKIFKNPSGYLKYYLFRAACQLVGWMPNRVNQGMGIIGGEISYELFPKKARIVYGNMQRVVPEGNPREWRRLARRTFYNYGRYWIDFLRCYWLTFEEIYYKLVVPHGTEWFDECLKAKKGVILALPHFGSWDMIGGWVGHQYPEFWAVAEQLEPPELYEFHTELRRHSGIRIIPLGEKTVEKVIEVLTNNGMVCLLSDRVIEGSGVEVDFFGGKIVMPIGPALLAIKVGAAILPCLTIREGDKYHGYVGPPLEIEVTGDTRHDVQVNSQKLAKIFEDFIRRDPSQWHMLQPIFKGEA
jgi:phosphatidylinositol dimannoside acyltransferase